MCRGPCGTVPGELLCDFCQFPDQCRKQLAAVEKVYESQSIAAQIKVSRRAQTHAPVLIIMQAGGMLGAISCMLLSQQA